VGKYRDTQVGEAALGHEHGHVVMEVEDDDLANQSDQKEQGHALKTPKVPARDVVIDGLLHDIGLGQAEELLQRQQQHGEPEEPFVG
jgi:hypothetical protein